MRAIDEAISQLKLAQKQIANLEHLHEQLHMAYLRLRSLIPEAYNTPFGPTPQEVWKHTEDCLRRALQK